MQPWINSYICILVLCISSETNIHRWMSCKLFLQRTSCVIAWIRSVYPDTTPHLNQVRMHLLQTISCCMLCAKEQYQTMPGPSGLHSIANLSISEIQCTENTECKVFLSCRTVCRVCLTQNIDLMFYLFIFICLATCHKMWDTCFFNNCMLM